MKKKLLFIVFLLVCFVNTCFASNGSVLDEEEKIADFFMGAVKGKGEYAELASNFTPGFAKAFTAVKFKETKEKVTTTFGDVKNVKLYSLEKLDKADRVIYLADATKVPNVEFSFVFSNASSKPLLDAIVIRAVEVKKQAPAKQVKPQN